MPTLLFHSIWHWSRFGTAFVCSINLRSCNTLQFTWLENSFSIILFLQQFLQVCWDSLLRNCINVTSLCNQSFPKISQSILAKVMKVSNVNLNYFLTLTPTLCSFSCSSNVCPVADHSCFFIGIFTFIVPPLSISIDMGCPLMCTFMSGLLFKSCMSPFSIPFYDNSSSLSPSESNCTCFWIPTCGFCGFIHFLQAAAICPVYPQL